MDPSIDKLIKYIELEAERGYDDKAVFGGLGQMLEPWADEAIDNGVSEELINAVSSRLADYHRMSPDSRKAALNGLLRRVERQYPEDKTGQSDTSAVSDTLQGQEIQVSDDTNKVNEIGHVPAETSGAAAVQVVDTEAAPASVAVEESAEEDPEATELTTEPVEIVDEPPAALDAPLTTIPGIGPKSAKTLAKLDLYTLGDLLWHFPRRYDDYSQLKTINRIWYGEELTLIGTVEEIKVRPVRSGKMKLVEAVINDGTGSIRVTWFNQAWIATKLSPGKAVVLSGKVDQYLGKLTLNSPEWEQVTRQQLHTNRIVPVYPLTAGITPKWMRRVMNSVVTRLAPRIPDPDPPSVLQQSHLIALGEALQQIHFPDSWDQLHAAQARLAFDEIFFLQLGVLSQKQRWEALNTRSLAVEDQFIDDFRNSLPYSLTNAQEKCLSQIRSDLATESPMNRLLQGDVGSGKTVLAAAAIAIANTNDGQAAIMTPTSILADQHLTTLRGMLTEASLLKENEIALLTGGTKAAEKKDILKRLKSGELKLVVGTHALLEDPVEFNEFSLAIIDEQHRFGVDQRSTLRSKGDNPNLLVMTATPIPRSLALTLYGDLDLSVLDELPPGRKPVETRLLEPIARVRAYNFMSTQVEQGRQAFIIYPLVEESEKLQSKAAVAEHERLQNDVYPNLKLGLVHGKLKPREKDAVMNEFRDGSLDILVSTSVVEVGVDVPNATVMLIEGANRFGLAQLHQLRGRIGRGSDKSYCLMIPDEDGDLENERLNAMEGSNDGFELAELDLSQRGPGDFLGTRQSGYFDLRLAKLTDVELIEKARIQAQQIFTADPDLEQEEHQSLANAVEDFWSDGQGELS